MKLVEHILFLVMANRIFSLTTLIILISTCDLQKVNAQYKLEKAREFQIKSLNSVEIVDYDPVKQQFLAYEKGGGEFVLLDYVKEIPYGTFEKKKKEDAQYHHFQDPDYHRVILFDERKQLSNDMKIPYGQIKIAMPNNSILIKLLNPDEEEDFVRYGVYKIVKN